MRNRASSANRNETLIFLFLLTNLLVSEAAHEKVRSEEENKQMRAQENCKRFCFKEIKSQKGKIVKQRRETERRTAQKGEKVTQSVRL